MGILDSLIREYHQEEETIEEAALDKFISSGDKAELKTMVKVPLSDGTHGIKTYSTSVYNVPESGGLELLMPTEQGKLLLLPVGGEYDICFYTRSGLYRASVIVADRQKYNSLYTLRVELTSSLCKYQRREYYRFNCLVEAQVRKMTPQEVGAFQRGSTYFITEESMAKSVIVDISGGGARFVAKEKYPEGCLLLLDFSLSILDEEKPFLLAAKVIYSSRAENRIDEYENRVKFEYINKTTREEIIRYIFDEDRKNRKNERGCCEDGN